MRRVLLLAALPRNAPVTVVFDKPVQAPAAGCSGTVQLSDDSFVTCAAGTFTGSDATWTFTPSPVLQGNATYRLRVTTAQKDANGIALASAYTSAGFTTAPALTAAVAPSGTVSLRPSISVTFNRPVTAPSVTSIESGTTCGGTVRVS